MNKKGSNPLDRGLAGLALEAVPRGAILYAELLYRIPYRRPLCSRLSLAQLNDYIFGSQFAVLYLFHNRSERKAQLRVESIKRLRSAIGARVSYCLSSSADTSKAPASFAKISSEGNLLPSSMSERKAEEMPILFANPHKDKSALSRNSWIRWPKEIPIMC